MVTLPARLGRLRSESGMVTAELACALPVLVVVLAAALAAISVSGQAVRAQDAARELARAAARGDPAAGRRLAAELAPGASMAVANTSAQTVATVQIAVHPLGGWLPTITVSGRAVAASEPEPDAVVADR
jgi:Flp pilus assembly protein TadG